ncbi:rhodanese-like domain-containing protein [Micrococcoides hystricis]|uniref:Rhodanese-like domain-containing protein n=1 Tax=Micrococcoides hystricis TaxID=1572761 RepID=A0ABV6PCM1_9MICC
MSDFETVTPEQIPAGAKIIDIREQDEWDLGHAEGAVHLPLSELADRIDEIDPDEDNYIICRSGGRSRRACEWLNSQGYTVIDVAGGSGAWMDAQLPLVSENGEEPTIR